jgi:hypothetical protein
MKKILVTKLSIENVLNDLQSIDDLKYLLLEKEEHFLLKQRSKKNLCYYERKNNEDLGEVNINNYLNPLPNNFSEKQKKLFEMINV